MLLHIQLHQLQDIVHGLYCIKKKTLCPKNSETGYCSTNKINVPSVCWDVTFTSLSEKVSYSETGYC